jgi:hypothetical protein
VAGRELWEQDGEKESGELVVLDYRKRGIVLSKRSE